MTDPRDTTDTPPTDADPVDADVEAADRRNGEPDATSDTSHPTGQAEAARNRENDPPA